MNIFRHLSIFVIGALLFTATALYIFTIEQGNGLLTVSFLDVGQGDSALIQTPSGKRILIDAGPNGRALRLLGERIPFWEKTIEVMIATHPDKDHIGGFVDILGRYTPMLFIQSGATSNNGVDEAVKKEIDIVAKERGLVVREAYREQTIDFADGVILTILYPNQSIEGLDTNDASIVLRITYGEHSFLFTGDAAFATEFSLLERGQLEKTTVLKVGHHGSRFSTGVLFLEKVAPEIAILSAGKDNSYGHPNTGVIESLTHFGAKIFRTDTAGTISISSNGTRMTVEQERI